MGTPEQQEAAEFMGWPSTYWENNTFRPTTSPTAPAFPPDEEKEEGQEHEEEQEHETLLAIGEECTSAAECVSGYCSSSIFGDVSFCTPYQVEWVEKTGERERPPTPAPTPTSIPILLGTGEICVGGTECRSGSCIFSLFDFEWVCAETQGGGNNADIPELPANGAICTDPSDCDSGRCVLGPITSEATCQPKEPGGSSCQVNNDCESGRCEGPIFGQKCLYSQCEECNENSDCVSENCFLGTCAPQLPPGTDIDSVNVPFLPDGSLSN